MATARRSATFEDSAEILWATVGDPHHLPRWWPGVQRVEDVDPGSFTQVLESKRGKKTVRADYAMVEQTEPTRCRWRSKPEGTPVERILGRVEVTVDLQPEGPATRVTLSLRRSPGAGRLGANRRAGRAELDEALAELGRIHG